MFSRRLARPLGAFAKEWTCPSCTRASVSQQISHRAFSRTARRNVRPLPESAFDERFQDAGVPRRLPSGEVTQKTEEHLFDTVGYRLAWTEYQKRTLQKLDELLAGEPEENDDIKALVLKFARDPMSASVFNHASMAFNNHFFFQSFSTDLQPLDKYALLEASLAQTFGSIDTLKTTFLDTAAAMFAPGFVWLVWCQGLPSPLANADTTKRGSWRILTTYAAGTPFPEAGYRAQGIDANNSSPESYSAYQATNSLGAFGSLSKSGKDTAKIPPGGTSVVPVLCVSTWEHSYIYNYGYDKRTYLSRWWDAIDWYRVEARFPEEARQTVAKSSLTYDK